jgi:predicted CoA-substrate-specific enzyme activase
MSHVIGCDVGSLTSKAVVLDGRRIAGRALIPSKAKPEASAEMVIKQALEDAKLAMEDTRCCVSTGYGRERVAIGDTTVSEIDCHARAARWLFPSVRTVIDIGGQDCKAIRLDDRGKVAKAHANDKCASGTGRFLDVMASVLNVDVEELGSLSAEATKKYTMSSACTLWAQAEVIKRLNSGYAVADIAAGINNAMAIRASILLNNVGIENDVLMTGGVAKNRGVVSDLESIIGRPIKRCRKADPQLAGAIGAALIARERVG